MDRGLKRLAEFVFRIGVVFLVMSIFALVLLPEGAPERPVGWMVLGVNMASVLLSGLYLYRRREQKRQ